MIEHSDFTQSLRRRSATKFIHRMAPMWATEAFNRLRVRSNFILLCATLFVEFIYLLIWFDCFFEYMYVCYHYFACGEIRGYYNQRQQTVSHAVISSMRKRVLPGECKRCSRRGLGLLLLLMMVMIWAREHGWAAVAGHLTCQESVWSGGWPCCNLWNL